MTATPETLWQVPAYLPYLQPPLTEAVVIAAEEEIGYKLPIEYLNLLKKQNGGYIRYALPKRVHDTIAGIGPHFPSLTDFNWAASQDCVSFPLQGLVPFDGDGHWHLCLDYREHPDAPKITHVDIECDRESPIASSFADYLAQLQLDVGEEYVIEGVSDIEQIKSALASALGIPFDDPPDTNSYGYPVYRARLGTRDRPEWIWSSPNFAMRGFVRKDDERFAELKDLMPGLTARFPEVPASAWLISADAVRTDVVRACVQSRMAVRPLREYVKSSA